MRIASLQGTQPANNKKNSHVLAKTAICTGAAAATVLYMAKTGKLNAKEGGNKIVEGVKTALRKPANEIINKAETTVKKITLKLDPKGNPTMSGLVANYQNER